MIILWTMDDPGGIWVQITDGIRDDAYVNSTREAQTTSAFSSPTPTTASTFPTTKAPRGRS